MEKKWLSIPIISFIIGYAIFMYLPTYLPQSAPIINGLKTQILTIGQWLYINIITNPIAFFTSIIGGLGAVFTIYSAYKNIKAKAEQATTQLKQTQELATQTYNDKLTSDNLVASLQKELTATKTELTNLQQNSPNVSSYQNQISTLQKKYDDLQIQYEKLSSNQDSLKYIENKLKELTSPPLKP